MITYILTCHTEGCVNKDAAIPLAVQPDVNNFICGGCSQQITDVVESGL